LAEELNELRMSAAELARQLGVPTNRITEIMNRRRAITRRHCTASGSFLRHQRGVLAKHAKSFGNPPRRAKVGEIHSSLTHLETPRTGPRLGEAQQGKAHSWRRHTSQNRRLRVKIVSLHAANYEAFFSGRTSVTSSSWPAAGPALSAWSGPRGSTSSR
jgi:hypothetical protein